MKVRRTAAIASRWVGMGQAGIIRERILFASGQVREQQGSKLVEYRDTVSYDGE